MINLLNNYTVQIVTLGATLLGLVCGLIGVLVVLKKESLVGDTVSHSSLPGICLAYIFTGNKDITILLIGALISGLLSTFLINYIMKNTSLNFNNVLSIVLSTFFGFGIVLLTYIQKMNGSNKAGLNNFIFGQSASILKKDVYLIIAISLVVLVVLFANWYKLKLLIFDKIYAETIYGRKIKILNLILSMIIVFCIVIGLEIVGVILMSSLIVIPAVAARQWSNSFNIVMFISMLIGGLSSFLGIITSSYFNLPSGPVIILILSIVVFMSLLFSTKRGLFKKYIYKKKMQKQIIDSLNNIRKES